MKKKPRSNTIQKLSKISCVNIVKFTTLLEHEDDDHGIMRTKEELFGDNYWDFVN